jgi:hypothetical protein
MMHLKGMITVDGGKSKAVVAENGGKTDLSELRKYKK